MQTDRKRFRDKKEIKKINILLKDLDKNVKKTVE